MHAAALDSHRGAKVSFQLVFFAPNKKIGPAAGVALLQQALLRTAHRFRER
jgi:hypothetical protein